MTIPSETFRRIYLPYCLQAVESRGHIVLNRLYKPLGIRDRTWIDYAPHAVVFPELDATFAAELSWDSSPTTDAIYLYNDGCLPETSAEHWTAYQQRLARLATLKLT